MILTDKRYDTLKFISLRILPALETFWLTVGMVWQLPYTAEIGATLAAAGMLLGGFIGMSKSAYEKAKKEEYEGEDTDNG